MRRGRPRLVEFALGENLFELLEGFLLVRTEVTKVAVRVADVAGRRS
jgi:hypothetical protein